MASKTILSSDSKSLWNFTLSPGAPTPILRGPRAPPNPSPAPQSGWTHEETDVLHHTLMKFGVGNWKAVIAEKVLPGKTIAQLVCQTQRLLGQQSLKGESE